MLVLATYAHNTTTGVAEDVQGFATAAAPDPLRPRARCSRAFVTLVVPLAVAHRARGPPARPPAARGPRRRDRSRSCSTARSSLGDRDVRLRRARHRPVDPARRRVGLTLPGYVALLAGLLTVVGPRGRRRTVDVVVEPALGRRRRPAHHRRGVAARARRRPADRPRRRARACGTCPGVQSERAYGDEPGRRRAAGRVRARPADAGCADEDDRVRGRRADLDGDAAARALTRSTDHRVYELTTQRRRGARPRRHRRRPPGGRHAHPAVAVAAAARDRGPLGGVAAPGRRARRAARLRRPRRRGPHAPAAEHRRGRRLDAAGRRSGPATRVPLGDLDARRSSPTRCSQEIWAQLQLAHDAGIAHRALTSDVAARRRPCVGRPIVWLTGWEQGDVASSELARRMDVTQLRRAARPAGRRHARPRVGRRRAARRARRRDRPAAADDHAAAPAPATRCARTRRCSPSCGPRSSRACPRPTCEPQQLVRFGARTVLTIVVPIVAVVFVITSINVDEITSALADERLALDASSRSRSGSSRSSGPRSRSSRSRPVRAARCGARRSCRPPRRSSALAAPAGIGPAALNLRMLTRRGVSDDARRRDRRAGAGQPVRRDDRCCCSCCRIASGDNESALPVSPASSCSSSGSSPRSSRPALLVPKVRQWVLAKTMPTLRQTWPRLIEVLGQPWRLALGRRRQPAHDARLHPRVRRGLAAFGQERQPDPGRPRLPRRQHRGRAGPDARRHRAPSSWPSPPRSPASPASTPVSRRRSRCCSAWPPTGCGSRSAGWRCGTCRRPASCRRDAGPAPVRCRPGGLVRRRRSGERLGLQRRELVRRRSCPASSSALASAMCSAGDLPATSRM